jgi:hypothetical protein
MNKFKILAFAGLVAAGVLAGQALANPVNEAPPPGWILSLDGQPLPLNGYQQYTATFTATDALTNISFALRDDPAYTSLDNIFVANASDPLTNLILNGDFEGGGSGSSPNDWSYLNEWGAVYQGVLSCNGGGKDGSSCYWISGAVQAYDAISQAIATTIGDTYTISFWAYENSRGDYGSDWSALSTNGDVTGIHGNGINIAVYAGAIPPPNDVPEPAALGMFGLGALLIGLFAGLRRRVGGRV